ncbi:hypothetical protein SAMN05443633_10395 [Chryseobacterium arachidis]|uniref:Uncharacterized protein n=1 Tax=Chryseobacterium arachidis TaxID=1416778 RepID=A0A1M4Z9M9_9FLAO|nr:hypothetical protein [Chryseobacterium arachidis]SHF14648.1 hypothetical protein SAMN05443633_10395 [Chryseobacterium arachidis]
MNTLDRQQCDIATQNWAACLADYNAIKNLIPTNFVFNFSAQEINWVKDANKNSQFCTEIGVYNDQLIAILCPMNASGQKVAVSDYPYSVLSQLPGDLKLTEIEEYIVVKSAILSKDLKTIDDNSNMYWPVANKPMMEQDKAVEAIESWRNEGMNWFYRECTEFGGKRIFNQFFVPAQNLSPEKEGFAYMVCSFGLKFSEVYQRVLPTLIFISFYESAENTSSVEKISNTYDWSQPCPPICPFG